MKKLIAITTGIISFLILSWFVAVNVGLIDTSSLDKTIRNIILFVGFLIIITIINAIFTEIHER